MSIRSLSLGLFAVLPVVPLAAQGSAPAPSPPGWSQLTPPTKPTERRGYGMIYDSTRNRIVLFGGANDSGLGLLDETWVFEGGNWTRLFPSNSPPPSMNFRMAYDSGRDRVVLYAPTIASGEILGNVWEFDGTTWTEIQSSAPVRPLGAMAYDSGRGVVVQHGGLSLDPMLGPLVHDETREWDGTSWKQIATSNSPPGVFQHVMAYDPLRGCMVLWGGADTNGVFADTWEYKNGDWNKRDIPNGPIARLGPTMDYDNARNVMILFGGVDPNGTLNETWEFDGNVWVQRDPSGNPPGGFVATAYDSAEERLVLLAPSTSRTFVYSPDATASIGLFGTACGPVTLRPMAPPWVNNLYRIQMTGIPEAPAGPAFMVTGFSSTLWGTIPLPASLDPFGMLGCTIHLSADYSEQIPVVGGVAEWSVPIPNDLSLAGLQFFNQGAVFISGANPAGVVVTEAAAATIGVR